MDAIQFWHDLSLPPAISNKLSSSDAFPNISMNMLDAGFCKNSFYPNGHPISTTRNWLYPCYAAQYIGYPIPYYYSAVSSQYSETAAIAAIKWLEKLGFSKCSDLSHISGMHFTKNYNGNVLNFAFPTMTIRNTNKELSALLPIPDTRENDKLWSNHGFVPYFIEVQARMLMWCWKQISTKECPQKAYVVRITGNTPSDITVYTISAVPNDENSVAMQICSAASKAFGQGKNPLDNVRIKQQPNWYERKQMKLDCSIQSDDILLNQYATEYLKIQKERKELEAKIKQYDNFMDYLAIRLSEEIAGNAQYGMVTLGDTTYTVEHRKKEQKNRLTLSADLVQQFCPEIYDEIVTTYKYRKGKISIHVLD